jgi:hypothetical protein
MTLSGKVYIFLKSKTKYSNVLNKNNIDIKTLS